MHRIKLTGAALAGLLLAEPLLAHSFDAQPSGGLLPGLLHPLTGADHLMLLLLIGFSATHGAVVPRYRVLLATLGLMAFGALLGCLGWAPPALELGLALSVLLLGALVATGIRPAMGLQGLVGVAVLYHGVAHGVEMPGGLNTWMYATGLLLASAGLLALGGLAGRSRGALLGPLAGAVGGFVGASGLLSLV